MCLVEIHGSPVMSIRQAKKGAEAPSFSPRKEA